MTSHAIHIILFFMHCWTCFLGKSIPTLVHTQCVCRPLQYPESLMQYCCPGKYFLGGWWWCVMCLIFFLLFTLLCLISYIWFRTSPVHKDYFEQSCLQNACCVSQVGISCIFYKDTLHFLICIIEESIGRHRTGSQKTPLKMPSEAVTELLISNRPVAYNENIDMPSVFSVARRAGLSMVLW